MQSAHGRRPPRRVNLPPPCSLCGQQPLRPKHHFQRSHLPHYFFPHTACKLCAVQLSRKSNLRKHIEQLHGGDPEGVAFCPDEWIPRVIGFLFIRAAQMKFVSPGCLLSHCQAVNMSRRDHTRGDAEILALREIQEVLDCTPGLAQESLSQLLDFHVLAYLLAACPSALSIPPQTMSPLGIPLSFVGSNVVVDAHFHCSIVWQSWKRSFRNFTESISIVQ